MNISLNTLKKLAIGVATLALAGSAARTQAQTIITNTYTFTFPTTGPSEAPFPDPTWIYWYNSPGGNAAIITDPTTDSSNPKPGANTSSSGSLMVVSPLGPTATQNVFFGTFADSGAYNFNTLANTLVYSSISFDILVASNTPLSSGGNYGSIGVGIITTGYAYKQCTNATFTIPASAATNWYHIVAPIDQTLDLGNVPGICLDINSYGGYPLFTITNWIDNISINGTTAPPPAPPTMSVPQKAVSGLNAIFTTSGAAGQNNRYQLDTVADTGYTFVGQPSVTYSWGIQAFPTNTALTVQQHFFIVNGAPGQYDQAADYNLADCIFVTVQQDTNGQGIFNFRYKTNEPGGNSMLFNKVSPTNTAVNSNLWPIMPIVNFTNSTLLGNWSLTFKNTTNVTVTAPGGATTNFVFDPASAALFADPVSLLLGAQPNSGNFSGAAVVYSNFSVTGNASPFTDNFLTDTGIETNIWKNLSNDTNGLVLVPAGLNYWVGWSSPATGYALQASPSLPIGAGTVPLGSVLKIMDNGSYLALVPTNLLPGTNQNYFSVVQRVFSQLQVLLPGETNAPNTPTGKKGTPTPISYPVNGGQITFTVQSVDAHWYPVPGATDTIAITSSDSGAILPNNAPLVNGTAQFTMSLSTPGKQTITAADVSNTNILANTSSQVTLTP
jgi:hypothetical protein